MNEVYSAVVSGPAFCVGVRCDAAVIHSITYLPPQAARAPENALAAEAVRQIEAYLAQPDHVFSLPLRVGGTPFQQRVWAEIAAIPCRQTRSYGALAQALGSAARAVGQACRTNPVPLIVPCHRVIAADGGLGGFAGQRGGFLLSVKRWLLLHEAG